MLINMFKVMETGEASVFICDKSSFSFQNRNFKFETLVKKLFLVILAELNQ